MAKCEILCPVADVPEGEIRAAMLADGTMVALYNVAGRILATADLCTHGEASLSDEGKLEGNIVECAWHHGRFDVTTGEPCASPCTVPLKTYRVRIVDGMIDVES